MYYNGCMYKERLNDVEGLRAVVASKRNIGECLDYFGITRSGKTYKTFRAICAEYGIELNFPDAYTPSNKIPNSEIFVEDSPYIKNHIPLKKRALAAGYIENKCSICSLGPEWNGKPLTLQLDHINGKNNDHRPENLRTLCPNCHTQTETYAGRRREVL